MGGIQSMPLKPAGAAKPALLLAHKFEDAGVSPDGYWMSEKLDGVRCFWDGKALLSRNGNPFAAPSWFTDKLPVGAHVGAASDPCLWVQCLCCALASSKAREGQWGGAVHVAITLWLLGDCFRGELFSLFGDLSLPPINRLPLADMLQKSKHLDGELFVGRGQFNATTSIVKTVGSSKWDKVRCDWGDRSPLKAKGGPSVSLLRDAQTRPHTHTLATLHHLVCGG